MRFNPVRELENMQGFKLNILEAWRLWSLAISDEKIRNRDYRYFLSAVFKKPFNWLAWECYHYNLFKRSQFWDGPEIKRYRFKKLRNLLIYAYNKVPYYSNLFRKSGFSPGDDFNSLSDLRRIPPLTREDAINYREQLVSNDFLKHAGTFRAQKQYTSGTTGKPLLLYSDLKRIIIWGICFKRSLERAGVSPIARSAQLWSVPFSGTGHNLSMKGALYYNYDEDSRIGCWSRSNDKPHKIIACFIPASNIMYVSTMPLSKECRLKQLNILNEFKPVSVTGNPSLLLELACLAEESNVDLLKFSVFISKYEPLWPHQTRIIKDKYGCRIYSSYSNREGTINAFGCEFGNYHEERESCVMEVVDERGNELPCGKRGKILGTDLFNYAMPFIRYDSQDMGIRHNSRCHCCRGDDFFTLDGRAAEKLVFKDKIIYSSTLSVILRDIQGIKECQFKQRDSETIEAYIVRRNFQDGALDERIAEKFRERIDPALKLVIKYVRNLNINNDGKFKLIDL